MRNAITNLVAGAGPRDAAAWRSRPCPLRTIESGDPQPVRVGVRWEVHGEPAGGDHDRLHALRGWRRSDASCGAGPSPTSTAARRWATVGSRLDDQPRLTFQAVPEPKSAKVRLLLDVQVDDIERARRQVEGLGGRWTGERHDYDEGVVVVMADPEGHEFCLVRHY